MTKPPGAALRGFFIALLCALFASATWSGTPPARSFGAYLIEGYGEMADAAAQNADNKNRASFFRERKGLAERGQTVAPVGVEGRALDAFTRREAGFARRLLVERLGNGAREKQPLLAAIAQVNFDCWVVAPSQAGSSDSDDCRRRFYFAFAGLRAKAPAAGATVPGSAPIASASPPPAQARSSIAAPAETIDPDAVQRAYATTLHPGLSAPAAPSAAQFAAAAPPVAAQMAVASPPPAAATAPGTAQIASASPPPAPPSSIAAPAEAIDPDAVQRAYATTLHPGLSAPAAPSAAQFAAAAPPVAAQMAVASPPPAAATAPGTAQIASASPPPAPPSSIAAPAEAIDPDAVQRAYATTLHPGLSAPAAPSAAQPVIQQPVAGPAAYAPASQNLEAVGPEPSCRGALIAGQCYQIAFTGPAADRLVTQLRTDADPYAYPSYVPTTVIQEAPGSAPAQYWYYCQSPRGYYPYIQACSIGWRPVPTAPQMAAPPPPPP